MESFLGNLHLKKNLEIRVYISTKCEQKSKGLLLLVDLLNALSHTQACEFPYIAARLVTTNKLLYLFTYLLLYAPATRPNHVLQDACRTFAGSAPPEKYHRGYYLPIVPNPNHNLNLTNPNNTNNDPNFSPNCNPNPNS